MLSIELPSVKQILVNFGKFWPGPCYEVRRKAARAEIGASPQQALHKDGKRRDSQNLAGEPLPGCGLAGTRNSLIKSVDSDQLDGNVEEMADPLARE